MWVLFSCPSVAGTGAVASASSSRGTQFDTLLEGLVSETFCRALAGPGGTSTQRTQGR